jgi:hypothetical protein
MNHLEPYEHPTWHERSYAPGTPMSMWFTLQDEAKYGCEGSFGHRFWAERHPAFTDKLTGLVWLPSITIYEVPRHTLGNVLVDRHGNVYLKATVESAILPSWVA